jgi:predicted amidohydrolase
VGLLFGDTAAGFFRDLVLIRPARWCKCATGARRTSSARHFSDSPGSVVVAKPGNEYTVFELKGWKCGILICYDNNVIENVRATALLGAEIIFMPHVTMCTPSTRPGAGFVDPALWENREIDPTSLRTEFDGLKGRAWLMKWLPARAYDNGIYAVFSNPIGMDDDQLKNGCSMVIDPFGDVIAECRSLDNEFTMATCAYQKIARSGGQRYREARKPESYRHILGTEHRSEQKVAWMPASERGE